MRCIVDENPAKSVSRSSHDDGPDSDITSWHTLLYTYRNFEKLDGAVDQIVKDSYCAYKSRYNDVEHLWSPLTDAMLSVVLSPLATGDGLAPCQLPANACSPADRRMKEVEAVSGT